MGQFIVKLEKNGKDYYLMWSTVVDAPVSPVMEYERFESYYMAMFDRGSQIRFEERMKRVNEKGLSAHDYENVEELIGWNRAGDNESCLTKDEIIDRYSEVEA